MTARRRSLDSVARRSRDAGTPISRASVHNLITGGSAPRRETLVGFLRGCGVPPREQIRWLTTFNVVFPDGRAPTHNPSAATRGASGTRARPAPGRGRHPSAAGTRARPAPGQANAIRRARPGIGNAVAAGGPAADSRRLC